MIRKQHKGFSLIEALVAAGILATTSVTICALGAKSLSALRVHQEYEKAWDVLDRQMVLIEQIGVQSLATSPNLSGVINDQSTSQQWTWRLEVIESDLPNLYDLGMTVEWMSSEGKARRIQCQTRLMVTTDPSTTSQTTTGTSTTGTQTSGTQTSGQSSSASGGAMSSGSSMGSGRTSR